MKTNDTPIRCAIYTRKSTEEGLEQDFNSLDAQREAGENYIASQKAEGWFCMPDRYDDGGFTGGNLDRPAVTRLMADIEAGKIDCIVVYKVDRLSRSLMDFARMMEVFERHRVAFVSVTQHFNTTHSMGRLTLNILLSFAQFEREIISERTRDKIAAARRKGKWSGGHPVLGYDLLRETGGSKLIVNREEADRVRYIFDLYIECGSLIRTISRLDGLGWINKIWTTKEGRTRGGKPFDKVALARLLKNVIYLGKVTHKDQVFEGEHDAIVDEDVFRKAGAMLNSNRHTGGKHVRNKYGALLKGLVRCKACGCAMMAFRKMQRSIYDAGRGLATQKDALAELGLTFEDLKDLKPEEQFKVLAEQLGKVEDDTKQAAISMMLFGRTGTNLIPMFEAGAEGITQLQQEARKLGLTMSREDAQAAEEFTDAMDALWKTVKMGVFNVGAALAPLLQEMAQSMTDTVVSISGWIKSNRDLIVTVLQVAAGILALGIGLVAFGAIVKVGAMALGAIVAITKVATMAFSVFGAVIGFLVSPIGMVIAALAALGAYTLTSTKAGGKALGWFGEKFGQLKEDGVAAYGGIVKALKSGDMGLAAKILWLTLKMWWKRGVGWLTGLWLDFKNFFIKIGIDAFTGLLLAGSAIWAGLETAWAHTVAFFGNIWDGFVYLFKATWTTMVKWARKAWEWIKSLFGKSTKESRDKAYAMIDAEADKAMAKAKNDAQRKIVARNRAQAMKLRQVEDEDQARQLAALTRNGELQRARARVQADEEQEIADDIAGARQAWADAVKEAHDLPDVKKVDDGPGTLESPEALLEKVKGVVAGLGTGLGEAADRINVAGTFSGAALGLMGGGTAVDRIAKATEDTAKNTKSLTKGKGATFK